MSKSLDHAGRLRHKLLYDFHRNPLDPIKIVKGLQKNLPIIREIPVPIKMRYPPIAQKGENPLIRTTDRLISVEIKLEPLTARQNHVQSSHDHPFRLKEIKRRSIR